VESTCRILIWVESTLITSTKSTLITLITCNDFKAWVALRLVCVLLRYCRWLLGWALVKADQEGCIEHLTVPVLPNSRALVSSSPSPGLWCHLISGQGLSSTANILSNKSIVDIGFTL
jgi:hypothetical protein